MKKSITYLITASAIMSLSACGASTGGLQNALAQKVASEAIQSTRTKNETTVVTPVATETVEITENMSPKCIKVAEKMTAVDARILAANETITGGNSANIAGQAAAAAASQGALHSGAAQVIGKVPFGGLFAKAAMDSVANSGKKKIEKAQKDLQKATLERAKLEGKFAGMDCNNS